MVLLHVLHMLHMLLLLLLTRGRGSPTSSSSCSVSSREQRADHLVSDTAGLGVTH